MSPTPTIEDLEKDVAARAQAVSDAQSDHAEAAAKLQAAKDAAAAPETGVPVSEVVPAPTPGPAAPEFVALDTVQDLVTKNYDAPTEPTPTYDPATGAAIGTLPLGTKFKATGKYQTSRVIYFNDGTHSVKTVDLGPDPDPAGASGDEGEKVPVHVLSPVEAMKRSYRDFIGGPARYKATVSLTLHDAAKLLPDVGMTQGSEGTLVGKFEGPDGTWNYLSKTSKDAQDAEGNGPWYGYPIESMQRVDAIENADQLEDLFDPEEAKKTEVAAGYVGKHPAVAAAGTSVGLINRLRGKK